MHISIKANREPEYATKIEFQLKPFKSMKRIINILPYLMATAVTQYLIIYPTIFTFT